MLLFWAAAYFLTSFFTDAIDVFRELTALFKVLAVLGIFATQWVYWTVCEVLFDGRTLGKRIAGIRVVRLDGSPVGLLESAIRNLLRVVDFLPALYAVGVLSMLLTREHRRLGDLAAGTVLVRDERVDLSRYEQAAAPSAQHDALPSRDVELILSFLERAPSMEPAARARLLAGLLAKYGERLTDQQRAQFANDEAAALAYLRDRAAR